MPKPEPRPTTPMPRFAQDLVGRRIEIPNSDVPTIGGKPVYQWKAIGQTLWQHTPKPEQADE